MSDDTETKEKIDKALLDLSFALPEAGTSDSLTSVVHKIGQIRDLVRLHYRNAGKPTPEERLERAHSLDEDDGA